MSGAIMLMRGGPGGPPEPWWRSLLDFVEFLLCVFAPFGLGFLIVWLSQC